PAGKVPAKAVAKAAPAKAAQRPVAKAASRPAKQARVEAPARPAPRARPIGKVAVARIASPAAPAPRTKVKVVPYKTDDSGRPIVPDGYKPSADEEYMNPLMLEYFRQRLLQWRADVVEESKQTIENLKDE